MEVGEETMTHLLGGGRWGETESGSRDDHRGYLQKNATGEMFHFHRGHAEAVRQHVLRCFPVRTDGAQTLVGFNVL